MNKIDSLRLEYLYKKERLKDIQKISEKTMDSDLIDMIVDIASELNTIRIQIEKLEEIK